MQAWLRRGEKQILSKWSRLPMCDESLSLLSTKAKQSLPELHVCQSYLMLLSRTVYSLVRGIYLAACELHIQHLRFLNQYVNVKTIWRSEVRKFNRSQLTLEVFRGSRLFKNRVCILPLVCSLHFTLSLHFTPGLQSAFHTSLFLAAVLSTGKRVALSSRLQCNYLLKNSVKSLRFCGKWSNLIYIISSVMLTFWLVLTYDLLEERLIDDVIIKTFLILYYIKQIDSKLPCVCSVIDHRGRQNVVRTSVTHSAASTVALFTNASTNRVDVEIQWRKRNAGRTLSSSYFYAKNHS